MNETKRVTLVSLPGLTWRELVTRTSDASMPALRLLVSRGAAAPLTRSKMSNTATAVTFVTGLQPEAHGVYFDDEIWAGGVRRVTRRSLQAEPIWQRLSDQGLATASINWPTAAPGASWHGVHVDADALHASAWSWDDWSLPLGSVSDAEREAIRSLRVHPADIRADQLSGFVPEVAAVDQIRDGRLGALGALVAHAASVQAIATWLLQERSPDLLCVQNDWLVAVRSAGPRATGYFEAAKQAAWPFIDAMIGRLAELGRDDRTILLVSASEQGDPGVFIACGYEISPGLRPRGVRPIDIAPTVLAALGWRDAALPGTAVLYPANSLAELPPMPPPPSPPRNDFQLLALQQRGFAPPPRPRPEWLAARATRQAEMTLSRAPDRARDLALQALALVRDHAAALSVLAAAYVALGDDAPLLEIAERLRAVAPDHGWGDLVAGMYHVMRGERAAAAPYLALAANADDAPTVRRAGVGYLAIRRFGDAEAAFNRALVLDPDTPDPLLGLARALFGQRRLIDAEKAVRALLDRTPDDLAGWTQLSHILQESGRTIELEAAKKVIDKLQPHG